MTISNAYEYLGTVRQLNRKIARLDEQILELRYSLLPGAIRYDKDRVSVSPKDTLSETFGRIDNMERERKSLMVERTGIVFMLYKDICRLPAGKERAFLLKYYIQCEEMEKIAGDLNVTVRHCFRLRSSAALMFAELQREI